MCSVIKRKMSDEAVLDSDAVASDVLVSLPAEKYQSILKTLKNQELKLKALKNLHQIIQSKDNELKASQEKGQNLQAALDKAENRLMSQIRLMAASGGSSCEEQSSSCPQNVVSISGSSDSWGTVLKSQPQTAAGGASVAPFSDLEADGAFFMEPVPTAVQPLSSPETLKPKLEDEPKTTDFTLQSRGLKTVLSTRSSGERVDSFSTINNSINKTSISGNHLPKSFGAVGVSKDLLDKLMQQNARLKKVIRDILNQRGSTFETYLETQEMQDVVEQLREELRLSKAQNEKLKEIINMKETDDLVKKHCELTENFLKLKRTATTYRAMADAYCKEYEKVKLENKDLLEKLSGASFDRNSSQPGKEKLETTQTRSQSGDSFTSCDSWKTQLDEALKDLKSVIVERDNLRTQCQQRFELDLEKEKKHKKEVEALETEKQLLQDQIATFQEDFIAERKENREKQEHREATIAKHQDWIKKLVAEAQKCRSLFEDEKSKRVKAESSFLEVKARFQNFILQNRTTYNCRSFEKVEIPVPLFSDLQVDQAPDHASISCPSPSSPIYAGMPDNVYQEQEENLVCPRCEREFEPKDLQKWKDHCCRCTDD